jgi:Icc protein
MKLAWATDIHLDHVEDAKGAVQSLCSATSGCEAIILTGDISLSNSIVQHLSIFDSLSEKCVYFVLGNHDYYFSDIRTTRQRVANACRNMSYVRYLATTPYVRLRDDLAIVGHDGWYDAMNGDARRDGILMNDWIRINDFSVAMRGSFGGKTLDKGLIVQIARAICAASVNHIANGIKAAIRDKYSKIIVATHVPPFKESYNGNKHFGMDASDALPWYTSKVMGEMLLSAAKTYPHVHFTILSGHSHSHYDQDLLNNLNVRVGKSAYGTPQIAGYIDI